MSTNDCNKVAANLKCSCSTYYYPKGSLFGDGYQINGICTKTIKGNYYCRNETWDRTGKYRPGDPDGSCYHKSTMIKVVGSGQKLISDLSINDVLEVFD
jgi:hypothetical protein